MKIKIHYSFFLILLLVLYSSLYIEFLILFISIILHELSHLFFIYLFKNKPKKLIITALGGIINVDINNVSFIKEIIIYSSGIIINIVIYYLSFYVPKYSYLIQNANLIMFIFNILPIYPLDGYRIIKVILRIIKNPFLEFKILNAISFISLLGLVYYYIVYGSIAILSIIIFLFYQFIIQYQNKDKEIIKEIVNKYNLYKSLPKA